MIKQAMILAAGFGKRINPLTLQKPKPLLQIGNTTLLANTLKFLSAHGIERVVINVHYLADQIIDYIDKNNFNLEIVVSNEKNKILDTGGGILNVIKSFSKDPLVVINPDTIWNTNYLKKLDLIEKFFKNNKNIKCLILVVNKEKSLDKSFKGDFSLKSNKISKKINCLDYIYTGLQVVQPKIFSDYKENIFSMNKVWDDLIINNELYGIESNIEFLHVSNLKIYEEILKKTNTQNI